MPKPKSCDAETQYFPQFRRMESKVPHQIEKCNFVRSIKRRKEEPQPAEPGVREKPTPAPRRKIPLPPLLLEVAVEKPWMEPATSRPSCDNCTSLEHRHHPCPWLLHKWFCFGYGEPDLKVKNCPRCGPD